MASDDKKTKPAPAPKKEALPKAAAPKEAVAKDAVPTDKAKSASAGEPSKAEAGEKPSGYSRGEGQKPVSKAYKDNWNAIFAKKKKR